VADPISKAVLFVVATDVAWPVDVELVAKLRHYSGVVILHALAGAAKRILAARDVFEEGG
jgi:hypothetical protein